ncbi:MAG: L,D-transpeptidase family protein [Bacteroidota bacterium]
MKNIFFILSLALIVTGCNDETTTTTTTASTEHRQSMRDLSITSANAYNDLFLDSTEVEKFIVSQKLNDTLAGAMRGFYNARNFEYAWFEKTGLIEQSFSFHSLFCTANDCEMFKSLEDRYDRLRIEDDSTINAKDPSTIKTELQITQRFIEYAAKEYGSNNITPEDLGTYIPAKKATILGRADAVLAASSDNKVYASINESYRLLKDPLKKYTAIAKAGGWPAIVAPKKTYREGVTAPEILVIKKRLQITGELAGNDTSALFDAALTGAINTYQQNHGYKPTGVVTADLVKDMNIPATKRVEQLLINMQRMRWMPTSPEGKLIIVNIPEFVVYVKDGKNILFQMDVVVGAEGHKTTMFSGDMNQVVFSPYWNVPPSIVRKEILPAIEKDANYLAKKDMEITGTEGGLPAIRQRPGEKNALGRVKFLFPNSFNIYLHDSPQKELFKRSERDLSHGCIRLSDPVKLANYLLQDSDTWTPEKIEAAMNSGTEQTVRLKKPVPVIITYYTAWVNQKGELHFVDDIYGHDDEMAVKMFSDAAGK